jgi:hypothetical protein
MSLGHSIQALLNLLLSKDAQFHEALLVSAISELVERPEHSQNTIINKSKDGVLPRVICLLIKYNFLHVSHLSR